MRRVYDLLVWVVVIAAVPGVFCIATAPDVEASLGIPACAGLPHNGPCRLCAPAGHARLPLVIDANNVRLVIGKRTSTSRMTHAWLVWETNSGTYVLDPTINWMACRSEQVGSRSYIPFYAFDSAHKYRAASSLLYAKN